MPFKITKRKDGGVLYEFHGLVTPEENQAARKKAIGNDLGKIKKIRYVISDYSKTENFSHTTEDVKKMAASARNLFELNPKMVMAFVMPNDLFFGTARVWRAYADDEDRVMVSKSRNEAEIWVHKKLSEESGDP